jgi:hypothetical protein
VVPDVTVEVGETKSRRLSDSPAWVFYQPPVGGVRFTGKFGAASYPQRGRGGPSIFLTSASCSTSSQSIDFAG